MPTAINVEGLVKRYGSTVALGGADLQIAEGSVHAVIGENGAGKSTLIKVLSGLVRPDAGSVEYFGKPLTLASPRDARAAGIATAFQELSLVPHLSVAENLGLPDLPRSPVGLVSGRKARAAARRHLAEWGIEHVNVRTPVESLSLSTKQQVEIVGALASRPRLLVLDEPTSALGGHEVEWLYRQVARARERGLTIIFVSHRLAEVRALCDTLTVLRNGKRAGSVRTEDVSDAEIIQLMIGQSLQKVFPVKHAHVDESRVALAARGLRSGRLKDASFELRYGEVVGIAGLQDHGQRELFRALFGADRKETGTVAVDGDEVRFRSPRDAIKAGMGISFVPEERATEGALLSMSGRVNLTLPTLSRFSHFGWINRGAEKQAVEQVLDQLSISERALVEPVDAFSGGNQQKIVIGKWLLAESKILLLYDPTRGVDIKTKSDIYRLVRAFAEDGGAVLFYSTELDEIVNVCDRAAVCYRGVLSESIELDNEALLTAMLGVQGEEVSLV